MPERVRTSADTASYWLRPYVTADNTVSVLVHTEPGEGGQRVITRLVIEGPDITAATLRSLPVGILAALAQRGAAQVSRPYSRLTAAIDAALEGADAAPQAPPRERLTRPDGTDPEGFSRRVAAAYNEAVLQTSYPAVLLAEEAGVPVTTVHRWVRDARRLGLLPPARRGRAG